MSFSKIVSIFAGLGSIFGVSVVAVNLANNNQTPENTEIQTKYEERITKLQKQVSTLQNQIINTPPAPVVLPPSQQVKPNTVVPSAPALPAPVAPAPPAAGNFE